MKNLKVLLPLWLFITLNGFGQAISPHFFGQNAWMPDTIGSKVYYGKLHTKWAAIGQSSPKVVRFGGIGLDNNKPTMYQYLKMVDSIRSKGAEPILQVPFGNGKYTATQAADIVKYINITKGRKVIYWSIGNEPDLDYSYTSSSQVAPYIKAFSSAMKTVDPSILVLGPEPSWYNGNIINGLLTPGGPYDITGKDNNGRFYIDIFSFHTYPFKGTQTRSSVISKIGEPGSFEDDLSDLQNKLNGCNTYHNRAHSPIKMAVTEANVNYINNATDDLYGLGANSFLGGQFWAEMLGAAMKKGVQFVTFWSVIEGNSNELNIGYIDRSTGAKKPTYFHFQMMAEHFKGSFLPGTDNMTNVKAFGYRSNEEVGVLILNQDMVNYSYTLGLSAASTSGNLKINVNAGIMKEHAGTIDNQSTLLLVFDMAGNLKKKVEYKLYGNADLEKEPMTTIYNVAAGISASIIPDGPTTFNVGGSVKLKANEGTAYTYQWLKDDQPVGANSSTYIATEHGFYKVKVSRGSEFAISSAVEVKVLSNNEGGGVLTGITQGTEIPFKALISPNPAKSTFKLLLSTSSEDPVSLKVYDISGKLCVQMTYLNPKVPLLFGEQLASGMYIATVKQGDKSETIKLIKTRH